MRIFVLYPNNLKSWRLDCAKASGLNDFNEPVFLNTGVHCKSSNRESFRAGLNANFSAYLGIDKNKKPLMPCHPARARELLSKGRAAVFREAPFTIILFEREGGACQKVALNFDPGSKITGACLIAQFDRSSQVIWAAHLKHRGAAIKKALGQRRAIRRGRRSRQTRYRKARFDNRTRSSGWLPPSIQSRVDQILRWATRLSHRVPIASMAVETVRFDMQQLQNPEISGVAYARGTLFGYEVREYLLEKWGRQCAYCGAMGVRLEIDHIQSKAKGGTNAVNNLCICCRGCNEKKGDQALSVFVKDSEKVKQILNSAQQSFKDAAAVNSSRLAIGKALKTLDIPVSFWSGGQTKYNRQRHNLPKEHWLDAACVGDGEQSLTIPNGMSILEIQSVGRGCRRKCLVNRFGFPRSAAKGARRVFGFQTGDLIRAVVPSGKKQGSYRGCVAVRATGNFNIQTPSSLIQGIQAKHCRLVQRMDGYSYTHLKEERRFLPALKGWVSASSI